MTGEDLIAEDIADEVAVRVMLRFPDPYTDAEIAQVTVQQWKDAIAFVLCTYGAQTREEAERAEQERVSVDGGE